MRNVNSIKVKLLNYLSEHIGMTMDGVITGVEDFGLFVQGVELPADGLVHIHALQDDYYQYDATTHCLMGRREGNQFRLGDVVKVEVFRVDVDRRELDFRIVSTRSRNRTGCQRQEDPLAVGGQAANCQRTAVKLPKKGSPINSVASA